LTQGTSSCLPDFTILFYVSHQKPRSRFSKIAMGMFSILVIKLTLTEGVLAPRPDHPIQNNLSGRRVAFPLGAHQQFGHQGQTHAVGGSSGGHGKHSRKVLQPASQTAGLFALACVFRQGLLQDALGHGFISFFGLNRLATIHPHQPVWVPI
jgi:hypothetical protein